MLLAFCKKCNQQTERYRSHRRAIGNCKLCANHHRKRYRAGENAKARIRYWNDEERRLAKAAKARIRWRNNPDIRQRARIRSRREKTGWDAERLDAAWQIQNGRCAICQTAMQPEGRSHNSVNADHDSTTGKLRELLCGRCNRVLGHIEKHGFLTRLVEYVIRHSG